MHKIVCQCCVDMTSSASWIIFDSVLVCDRCRLTAIEWMRAMGFSLASSHPFTDELTGVTTQEWVKDYHRKKFLRKTR